MRSLCVPGDTGKDGVTTARVLGAEDYLCLGAPLLKNLAPSP
ncbi:hypothetical protein QMK61_06850 [Fulvimonas sp. R45]|nr:hypothetical protein [Fulvimonas sp. R45]MDO1528553.1 hypothetical protein [Fulvimonas sp. R45]